MPPPALGGALIIHAAQVLFLLYHYFNAREIYNAIRVFIAGYVWMTGFGNFSYYYKTKDFCLGRCEPLALQAVPVIDSRVPDMCCIACFEGRGAHPCDGIAGRLPCRAHELMDLASALGTALAACGRHAAPWRACRAGSWQ